MNVSVFVDVEVSENRMAQVAYEQRDVLTPLLRLCPGAAEQRDVIRALATYLDRPGDAAAMQRWVTLVASLRGRA